MIERLVILIELGKENAILLSDPANELEKIQEHYATSWGPFKPNIDAPIAEALATNIQGPLFITVNDSYLVVACSTISVDQRADRYYIPVHCYCLKLAKAALGSHCYRISTVRQLWKALRVRCLFSVAAGRMQPLTKVYSPNDYYLPTGLVDKEWTGGDDHWVRWLFYRIRLLSLQQSS